MARSWGAAVSAVLLLGLIGCGGLRYSHVSPDAKDFRPERIAVFPADSKTFPEAKEPTDLLFAEALRERKWFASVVGGEEIGRRLQTDEPFRQTALEFLTKLDRVNFCDPALSRRIGESTKADAILLVRVDYWNYTTENDKKVGKVSLSLTMIDAEKGRIVWTAAHQRASDYLILKPALPDVARGLIREMIDHMPR